MQNDQTIQDGQVKYSWSYDDGDPIHNDMISAKEARSIANKVRSDEHDSTIQLITDQITKDCKDGDSFTRWEGDMPASVEDELKKKGYRVEHVSGGFSGDSYCGIYW